MCHRYREDDNQKKDVFSHNVQKYGHFIDFCKKTTDFYVILHAQLETIFIIHYLIVNQIINA